jgi:tetratricopeptide (TPR) repeat protein
MSDRSTTGEHISAQARIPEDEQTILDTALRESDQLLARSLQDDQRRRRWRYIWLFVLVIGGVVVSTVATAIMLGWLVLTGPVVAESPDESIKVEKESTMDRVEQAEELATAGWQLWKERQFSAAAEKFEAALKLDPEAANAWNGLGWSRFNGGESEQALAAFEKCVALQPRHPAALNGLGQVYLMWKQYDEAEKYLLLAAPQAPAAWYGLARLNLLQERFAEAKPWVEKIAAQDPGDESVQRMLKAVAAGKLDDDLRRAIEPPGKPKAGSADTTRAWAMFQQGKSRTAERLFRRALKSDAENLSALNGLAFCLLNQGNHDQAKPLFEKYLAKEKDAPGPMNGLARCLKAEGKTDEAIELWEQMAKKYPGPNAAAVGLATTYLEQSEFAKSLKYFEILVASDPTNEEFQDGLKHAKAGLDSPQ